MTRVTLVYLTNAKSGASSPPVHRLWPNKEFSPADARFIKDLNAETVFLDAAHIQGLAFWDAVDVHDRTHPFLVIHTSVTGVTSHWRNLDDDHHVSF